ncbi:hypothetical protein V8E54_013140 [Elaphomyces granulatus]
MELQDDVLQSQHHLLRDEDTVVELVKLKAELPQKGSFAEPSRDASLKSKHPSARKATALSALPPLMIPLPPALPSWLGSAKAQALLRKFCSKRQFDNRVPVSEEKLVL